ncbi:hypothetical protein HF086_006851 [Spodoptera exigua]|uniref:Peptidase S1 domain-containing protein n=1 Tax=Spodoptera exigua TaxID=7107 RepID=A0A922MB53_SPOEX|nr:hypothetical protein HF086_006851 [Spodoptera exigua]
MMFCLGVLIEAHVVLTTANCVLGEKYKFFVVGGTHKFLEHAGITRTVNHLCIHKGYNTSQRWSDCLTDNLALLVLNTQFSFNKREPGTDFLLNRVRYGTPRDDSIYSDTSCKYYGWGSRRNDDVGSVIVCSGYAKGIMVSRLVDRPCGVGFLDLSRYTKFLTCGVDDSRDVLDHDSHMEYDFTTVPQPPTPSVLTVPPENKTAERED